MTIKDTVVSEVEREAEGVSAGSAMSVWRRPDQLLLKSVTGDSSICKPRPRHSAARARVISAAHKTTVLCTRREAA